jgi:hypothetical protein
MCSTSARWLHCCCVPSLVTPGHRRDSYQSTALSTMLAIYLVAAGKLALQSSAPGIGNGLCLCIQKNYTSSCGCIVCWFCRTHTTCRGGMQFCTYTLVQHTRPCTWAVLQCILYSECRWCIWAMFTSLGLHCFKFASRAVCQ